MGASGLLKVVPAGAQFSAVGEPSKSIHFVAYYVKSTNSDSCNDVQQLCTFITIGWQWLLGASSEFDAITIRKDGYT